MVEVTIHGRIASLSALRIPGDATDAILVTTSKFKFVLLTYDPSREDFVAARSSGDLKELYRTPSDFCDLVRVDPHNRFVAVHLYHSTLKIIPIVDAGLGFPTTVLLNEPTILDFCFLATAPQDPPLLAVLCEDALTSPGRHLRTFTLSPTLELSRGPFALPNVDITVSLLIPLPAPLGGLLLIGETSVSYYNGIHNGPVSVAAPAFLVRASAILEGTRCVLGDSLGRLFMLTMEVLNDRVTALRIEALGKTVAASTLSYLGHGLLFIGSTTGDSELVSLLSQPEDGAFVRVLQQFTSLGPIIDFEVIDPSQQGLGMVVTCSGAFQDGSLRLVRNGIGIDTHASVDLRGVKGLWSLPPPSNTPSEKLLAVAFTNETRFLSLVSEQLNEMNLVDTGFLPSSSTVFVSALSSGEYIQVLSSSVRLLSSSLSLTSEFVLKDLPITLATACDTYVLLACTGGNIILLRAEGGQLVQTCRRTLEHEVSAVALSFLPSSSGASSLIVSAGLWMVQTVLLLSPSFATLAELPLDGAIATSIMFTLDGGTFLHVGTGDGFLHSFPIRADGSGVGERKTVAVGTQPLRLRTFRTQGEQRLFVSSDRPSVVAAANQRLQYSYVNMRDVTHACEFDCASFPEALAIATEDTLYIASLEDSQRLHIRSLPMGEMPRRLAHHPELHAFAVVTLRVSTDDDGVEYKTSSLLLLHDETFEVLDSYALSQNEIGLSVLTVRAAGTRPALWLVGTAFETDTGQEPTRGRVLGVTLAHGRLQHVLEREADGPVYALAALTDAVLACVGAHVVHYEWAAARSDSPDLPELSETSRRGGHVLALYLVASGDFILVGDMTKSMALLRYDSEARRLVEVARDYNPHWLSAIAILQADQFMGVDHTSNLFTLQSNSDATHDEERAILQPVGYYHMGDNINRFRKGALVVAPPSVPASELPLTTTLFGTVGGVIGVVAQLPEPLFDFFKGVERAMEPLPALGSLSHEEWRAFENERLETECRGFVDGDFVEGLLTRPRAQQEDVAARVGVPLSELLHRIATFSRYLK